MASIFTRIIKGEIPCYKVAEDEHYFAFLDINPVAVGHTLVIPKQETDYIFDLDDDTLAGLHVFAAKVAQGLKKAVPCLRVGVVVAGLEVPHAHIHLIPMNSMDDLYFGKPKKVLSAEEMQALSAGIQQYLL